MTKVPESTVTDEDASHRTRLAEDRTLLANERTFGGWTRTAVAVLGVAIAFRALFDAMRPPWLPRAVASGFAVLAVAIMLMADFRQRAFAARLRDSDLASLSSMHLRVMTAIVSVAGLVLLATFWSL